MTPATPDSTGRRSTAAARATTRPTTPTWPTAIALLVAAAGLGLVGGPAGLAAAGLVAATWYALGDVAGFAAGQVAVAALAPAPLGPGVAVAEAGLVVGLAAGLLALPFPARTFAAFVVAGAGVGGVVAVTHAWTASLPASALAVVGTTALLAYGLHRYELVRLDLVEPSG